jgi:hypothetical protein
MVDEVLSIPEIFAPFRVTIIGTPNLDATRAVNAAYRAGIRGDRALCNAAGGLVGGAGSQCYFGEEAYNKAESILAGNAPKGIKTKAQNWLDANPRETEDTAVSEPEDTDTGEDTSAISDENAIASVLATVPEKLKGIITADNIIKVLEEGAKMNDPMTKIKRAMGAGVQFEWPGDWRNWKVFGPLAIPGVPLPPGIIDITIGEIIDAVGNIGGNLEDFVTDPIGTLGELGGWVTGKVEEVFGGDADDPGWGGTLGGFEDWVKGTLGGIVGGAVLVDIYDGVKDVFTSDTATTVVPGGEDTDDDTTKTLKQGDDIVSLGGSSTAVERPKPDDIFGDTTDDLDDDVLVGGREAVDRDQDIFIPDPEPPEPDPVVIGTGREAVDRDQDIFIPDPEPPEPDPVVIGTGREAVDRDQDIFIPDPEPPEPDPIVIGGSTDGEFFDPEPTPEPVEIGGPEPTPSSGGGGGGGGGAGGTAQPFLRRLSYTPTVPVAVQQQAPVDYASGLMTAPAPVQPSGLMRPTNSMDVLGQLIFRNLA